MILELDTKSVARCVNYVNKITSRSKKGSDALHTHMQVRIKKGMLSFIATDKHYSVLVNYGGVGAQEDFACMIEVDGVRAITNYASAEVLSFDFSDKKVVIKEGKNKYNLKYFSEFTDFSYIFDDYPIDTELPIKCTSEDINKAANFLNPCIAQDVARSFLRGIYYDGNLVATDSINCGVCNFNEPAENSFFMIRDGLELLNAFPKEDTLEIGPVKNMIVVRNYQATFLFPQLAADFPKYDNVITTCSNLPNTITLQKLPLNVACNKLLPFTDSYQRQVAKMTFSEEEIVINCYHEKKEANEYVGITSSSYTDKDHSFLVDLKAFTPLISSIPGEELTISFSSSTRSPIKVTDNNGYTMYISKLIRRDEPMEEQNVSD